MEFDLHMCALQPNVSKEKARIFTRHIYGVLNESTCLARQTMALMPQISHLTRATKINSEGTRYKQMWQEHQHQHQHQPNQAT